MYFQIKCLKFVSLISCLTSVLCSDNLHYSIEDVYEFNDFENRTDEKVYLKYIPPNTQCKTISASDMRHIFDLISQISVPIRVNSSFLLYNFGSIDDMKSEFSISLLLRFRWLDERLKIDTKDNKVLSLEGGKYHLKRIWSPSLYIPYNEFPDFLQNEDRRPVLTKIYTNGEVLVSKRINLKGYCEMDYTFYPMDEQLCDMEIESIDMSDEYLVLEWSDYEPFTTYDDFNWSAFQLTNYTLSKVKSRYKGTGTFSKLVATFTLRREFWHFLLDVYVPSTLFVISSWTSFWVEIPAAPARATLGLTTMLTLVTSARATRDQLPRVSYIHALDIWILMCTFFIFASLVEYATVNFIYHKEKRGKTKQKGNKNKNNINVNELRRTQSTNDFNSHKLCNKSLSEIHLRPPVSPLEMRRSNSAHNISISINGKSDSNVDLESISINSMEIQPKFDSCFIPLLRIKRPEDIANEIDRKCRLIFPISFLVINVIYWTTLTVLTKKH